MKPDKKEKGFLYLASGDKFIKEAIISCTSLKKFMPEIPVTLISDKRSETNIFDNEIIIDNPRYDFGDQIFHIDKTPYERTICIDTDMYFVDSIEEVFNNLDNFDIALCVNSVDWSTDRIDVSKITDIPECFPEYNSGLVAFKKNDNFLDFLSVWKRSYKEVLEQGQNHNQGALRIALYESDIRIGTLRNNYNFMIKRPGCVSGNVKVFHVNLTRQNILGTNDLEDLKKVFEKINSTQNLRLIMAFNRKVKIIKPPITDRLVSSLKKKGVKGTIHKSFKKLSFI